MLLELRHEGLARATLPSLLTHLVDSVRSRLAANTWLEVPEVCQLPLETKIAFYRIAQEALNNIIKHAQCKNVVLQLVCENQAVRLSITDDGVGLAAAPSQDAHLGLKIRQERAQEAGAHLAIMSPVGQGTQITCTWPTQARQA